MASLTALRSVDDAGASEGGCGRVEGAVGCRSLVVLMPVDLRGFAAEELELVGGYGGYRYGALGSGVLYGCLFEGAAYVGAGDFFPEVAEGGSFLVTEFRRFGVRVVAPAPERALADACFSGCAGEVAAVAVEDR